MPWSNTSPQRWATLCYSVTENDRHELQPSAWGIRQARSGACACTEALHAPDVPTCTLHLPHRRRMRQWLPARDKQSYKHLQTHFQQYLQEFVDVYFTLSSRNWDGSARDGVDQSQLLQSALPQVTFLEKVEFRVDGWLFSGLLMYFIFTKNKRQNITHNLQKSGEQVFLKLFCPNVTSLLPGINVYLKNVTPPLVSCPLKKYFTCSGTVILNMFACETNDRATFLENFLTQNVTIGLTFRVLCRGWLCSGQ